MFPLLRKRSKKSKDNIAPPSESLPPLPRPMTTAGIPIPLVHRHVRGLPISLPFTKVEFRNRSSPSSHPGFHSLPHGGADLSDETTLATSPTSLDSRLTSGSEGDVHVSPLSSQVGHGSTYDKTSVEYYDADDTSHVEYPDSYDDRVSYHRWSASSESTPVRPSNELGGLPSPSSTDSSLSRKQRHSKGSVFSGSSQAVSVDLDNLNENYTHQSGSQHRLRASKREKNPERIGILRWENDLDGIVGHQRLWIHIYQEEEEELIAVDRVRVVFPPELDETAYEDLYPIHISRPLPHEVEHKMVREPYDFEKQAEELELYRKELEYIAAIPSQSVRGPVRPIGVVVPSLMANPPCLDLPDTYHWKVTQRNIIKINHSTTHKKWVAGSILGEGTFGRVYLTHHVQSRVELAMKVVYIKRPMSKIVCQGLVNELKVFERLTKVDAQRSAVFVMKPNTSTGLWAWQSSEGFLHITSQFCSGGDLYEYIGRLSPDQLRLIIAELALGIESLHDLGIVHHDLKPENVLVDEEGHCVISDYGGSKFLSEGLLIRKTKDEVICTLPYAAPELLSESTSKYKPYDEAIDYWALGTTIFMLATGQELFKGDTEQVKQKHSTVANTLYDLMRGLPHDLVDLTAGLLTLNPGQRLRGPAVRSHPYFSNFKGLWHDITHKRLGAPIPFVRNVGGHARGYSPECKRWPSHTPESEGGPKTAYLLNVVAKEGLELPYDESFDVPMEHGWLTG